MLKTTNFLLLILLLTANCNPQNHIRNYIGISNGSFFARQLQKQEQWRYMINQCPIQNPKKILNRQLPCYSYWSKNGTQCKQRELFLRLNRIKSKKEHLFNKLFNLMTQIHCSISKNRMNFISKCWSSNFKKYHSSIFRIDGREAGFSEYLDNLTSKANKCLNSDIAIK